jgi:hypothetical protein
MQALLIIPKFVSTCYSFIDSALFQYDTPSYWTNDRHFDDYVRESHAEQVRKLENGFTITTVASPNFLESMRKRRKELNKRAFKGGLLAAMLPIGLFMLASIISRRSLKFWESTRRQILSCGVVAVSTYIFTILGVSRKTLAGLDLVKINQDQVYRDLDPNVSTEFVGTAHLDYTSLMPVVVNGQPVIDAQGHVEHTVKKWKREHNNVPLDKILAAMLAPLYNEETWEEDRPSVRLKAFRTIREISPNIDVRDEEIVVDLALLYMTVNRNHTVLSDRQERKIQNYLK